MIVALVFLDVLPKSNRDPSELAVSISTPASATPAQATCKTLKHCFKNSGSFKKHKEAKTNSPPMERLDKGPKNPKLSLRGSFSGSKGNIARAIWQLLFCPTRDSSAVSRRRNLCEPLAQSSASREQMADGVPDQKV